MSRSITFPTVSHVWQKAVIGAAGVALAIGLFGQPATIHAAGPDSQQAASVEFTRVIDRLPNQVADEALMNFWELPVFQQDAIANTLQGLNTNIPTVVLWATLEDLGIINQGPTFS